MNTLKVKAVAALLAMTTLVGASAAQASTFFAWRVANVETGDLLNVRAYPSSSSRILVGYPNGTRLSMTGRCTGNVHMDNINGAPRWQQREAVRYQWCEAWLDPAGNGEFRTGWVYGRYIRPA